ncbi:unnamed protein product, partial [Ectocarpus sp. 8 AP-2014]
TKWSRRTWRISTWIGRVRRGMQWASSTLKVRLLYTSRAGSLNSVALDMPLCLVHSWLYDERIQWPVTSALGTYVRLASCCRRFTRVCRMWACIQPVIAHKFF